MSTRGLLGFKYNGVVKMTYNHSDSYPSGLGLRLKEELNNYSVDEMKEAFDKIIMVDDDRKKVPYNILKELLEKDYISLSEDYKKADNKEEFIYNIKDPSWYFIVHSWQGRIEPYIDYSPAYMTDGEIYNDPVSIEYTYIINLDNGILECRDCYADDTTSIDLETLKEMTDEVFLSIFNE